MTASVPAFAQAPTITNAASHTLDVGASGANWSPSAGDIVVVELKYYNSRAPVSVSGLGLTWAAVPNPSGPIYWFIGTGTVTPGVITATHSSSGTVHIAAYLVRGLNGAVNPRVAGVGGLYQSTPATSATPIGASDGQAVLVAYYCQAGTGVFPDTEVPAGIWTYGTALSNARSGWATPSGAFAYHSVSMSGSFGNQKYTNALALGEPLVATTQVENVLAEVVAVSNTAQVENVGAEVLLAGNNTAQVENVLAEVLYRRPPVVVDPAYAAAVMADAPLAYWKLNDASGTQMTDSSGNNRHGVYSGAVLGEYPIRPGGDYAAKGTNIGQGVGSVANAAWMPIDTFSIEFWVYHNAAIDAGGLVSRYSPGWIVWQRSGRLSLTMIPSSQQDKTGYPFSLWQASHFVMVCVPGRVRAYVDGVLAWTYTWSGTFGPTHAPGLQIGGYSGGNYSYATFSDVAYYSQALSPARIAAHYGAAYPSGATDPASVAGLVGRYDASAITGVADGAAVAPWSDVSGNAKHLATIGAGRDPVLKTNIVNGKSVVRFDGSNDALAGTVISPGDTTTTIIAVFAVRSLGTIQVPVSMQGGVSTNSGPAMALGTTGLRALFAVGSSILYGGGQYVASTFERWVMVINDLQSVLYVNDIIVEDGPAMVAGSYLQLAGSPTQSLPAAVDHAEVLVYNRPLTDPEIYGIDEYLKAKWFTPPPPPAYIGWGVPRIDPSIVVDTPPASPTTKPYLADSILWLASSSLGTPGTTPSTWTDSSPAARTATHSATVGAATIVGASTPKGGKSVAFAGGTGGPCFTVSSYGSTTDRDGELWMVVKSNDAGGNGWCKFGGDAGQMNHYGYGNTVYDDTGTTGRQTQDGAGITSWHIYRVRTSGTARTVYRNGTQIWSGTVARHWRLAPVIAGNNAASYFFNGNIAEVIMFGRALTAGEATDVQNYLNSEHFA